MKKLTWNELHSGTHQELKKTYRLNDRQFEQAVRRHMDGASPDERRGLYKSVWDKKK